MVTTWSGALPAGMNGASAPAGSAVAIKIATSPDVVAWRPLYTAMFNAYKSIWRNFVPGPYQPCITPSTPRRINSSEIRNISA